MSVAGEIVIELKLDENNMVVNVKKAGAALQDFQTKATQTAASVKRLDDSYHSLGGRFGRIITTLGMLRFAVMDVNDLLLKLPMSILKSAGELEKMQVLMTGLSKETSRAAREAEGLKNFNFVTGMAKTAPFEIGALSDAFVKLKTAGMDPANGSMKALVDSVAKFGGTGETLKRASIAIQQMSGKGVISMEELRQQLGEAVPTAMQDMADGMGVSMAQLAKIVKTGTLTSGPALAKMLLQMRINNDGAAAEMMKTWVGALARLKSEWELAAKSIADAGFGDAAKKAVAELITVLQNPEFKQFALQAGDGLGSVLSSVVSLTKTLVEYREEISMAAKAWLAYKLVFSIIPSMSESLARSYDNNAAAMKRQASALGTEMSSLRAGEALNRAVAESRLSSAAATQTAAMSASAAHQAEMASFVASRQKMIAAQLAAQAVITRPLTGNDSVSIRQQAVASAQAVSKLASLRTELDNNAKSQAALGVAMAASNGEMMRSGVAVREAATVMGGLTTATRAQAAASIIANGAHKAGSLAMGLMGGPLGLLITGIVALVYWWNSVSAAAREAEDRQRRALNFTSREGDLKMAEAAKKKAAADMIDARTSIDVDKKANSGKMPNGKLLSDYVAAKNAFNKADLEVAQHSRSLGMSRAKQAAEDTLKQADVQIDAIKEASALKRSANDKAMNEQHAQLTGKNATVGSKAHQDIKNANTAKNQAELQSRLKAELAVVAGMEKSAFDAAQGMKEGAEKSSKAQTVRMLQERRGLIEADIKQNQATADTKTEHKEVKEKGEKKEKKEPIVSKVEAFVSKLKADTANLQTALGGLVGQVGKTDEALAELAELESKFDDDTFTKRDAKGKEVKLSKSEKDAMREWVERNANMKTLVADARKIAGEVNEMAPDYQQALASIADPLAAIKAKESNKFDEMIAKLKSAPQNFEAMGKAAGLAGNNVEEMIAKLTKGKEMAGTIDLEKTMRGVLEGNQALELEIELDERARTARRIQLSDTLAAAQGANSLRQARSAGVAAEIIDKYESQLAQNTQLRIQYAQQQNRSPMEKLADDWKLSLNKMDDATAQWSSSFVDMISNSAKTGKMEFGSFVQSVLADILKIQLQRTLGDPLKDIMAAGTKKLGSYLPDLLSNGGSSSSGAAGASGTSEVAREFSRFSMAAIQATDGLGSFLNTGVKASTDGLVQGLLSQGQQAIATTSFTTTIGMATAALSQFISTLSSAGVAGAGGSGSGGIGSIISKLFGGDSGDAPMAGIEGLISGFALGGIMSEYGPVPLRKYAAGGIARSPQLALYGEAGPEAYVPLPDGRSIPVTMQGGGASAVTINVINQSGQDVGAQQGQPRFDGKQMILDVVLTASNQPGGFRDGMKGAFGR